MPRLAPRFAVAALLGAGLAGLAAGQAKKDDAKPADWSKFADAGKIVGEVTKIDNDGFSMKSKVVPGLGVKARPEEVQLKFAEGGLLRWKTLPPKLDEKNKKVPYTPKEMAEKKEPRGAPAYAADLSDLKVGQIIEVTLVRPKEVPAAKAVAQDFTIKYAVILGENPANATKR